MQKESAAFEQFRSSLESTRENELADITNEIRWLSQAKLVLDELNIMTFLFETQKQEFGYMHHIVQSTNSEPTQPPGLQVTNTNGQNDTSSANQKSFSSSADETRSAAGLDGQTVGGTKTSKSSSGLRDDLAGENAGEKDTTHLPESIPNHFRSETDGSRVHTRVGAVWTQLGGGLLRSDVERSIEDVRGMTERAKRAYKSVSAPASLQEKQSTKNLHS
jgi:hypothetical protein